MYRQHFIGFVIVVILASTGSLCGQQSAVGFVEEFALADDRAAMLDRLVPGSSDFYYYSCLERQHAGKLNEVPALLTTWVQRHGENSRVREIRIRQALLSHPTQPKESLDFLKRYLNLSFDHQQQIPGAEPDLPTALDQGEISTAAFLDRALKRHGNSLEGINGLALESLASANLGGERLQSLLNRLERPDLPNLAALVLRELGTRRSRGFGSLKIHTRMTLAQLEECATTRPALLGEKNFVIAYLKQLRPTSGDPQGKIDPQLMEAYLDRLEGFTARLPAAMNSLKARVLHERLLLDQRARNRFDRKRLARLSSKLPRRESWVKRRSHAAREQPASNEVSRRHLEWRWLGQRDRGHHARIRLYDDEKPHPHDLLTPYFLVETRRPRHLPA